MDERSGRLDAVFSALADPTRREMLSRLTDGSMTVGELAEPFEMSRPAISQHLKVLERAGLIERTATAQWRTCTLRAEGLDDASAGSTNTGAVGTNASTSSTSVYVS